MLPRSTDSTDAVAPDRLEGTARLLGDVREAPDGSFALVLRKEENPRCRVTQTATARPDGTLVIDGYDAGALVEEFHGTDEYEYALSLTKAEAAKLLLMLLGERFEKLETAREWLEKKGFSPVFKTGF